MNKPTMVTVDKQYPLQRFLLELVHTENAKHGPGQFSDEFLDWMAKGVEGHCSQPLTEHEIFLMRWAFDAGVSKGYSQGIDFIAEG